MDSDLEKEVNVGVAEYLKEWCLSQQSTVAHFEENQISFPLLDHIQETELKDPVFPDSQFERKIIQAVIKQTPKHYSYVRDFCYCASIGFKIVPTVRIQYQDTNGKKRL
ncbi:hypothetical protein ACJJTC_002509 [Scirpophaga incertulas]